MPPKKSKKSSKKAAPKKQIKQQEDEDSQVEIIKSNSEGQQMVPENVEMIPESTENDSILKTISKRCLFYINDSSDLINEEKSYQIHLKCFSTFYKGHHSNRSLYKIRNKRWTQKIFKFLRIYHEFHERKNPNSMIIYEQYNLQFLSQPRNLKNVYLNFSPTEKYEIADALRLLKKQKGLKSLKMNECQVGAPDNKNKLFQRVIQFCYSAKLQTLYFHSYYGNYPNYHNDVKNDKQRHQFLRMIKCQSLQEIKLKLCCSPNFMLEVSEILQAKNNLRSNYIHAQDCHYSPWNEQKSEKLNLTKITSQNSNLQKLEIDFSGFENETIFDYEQAFINISSITNLRELNIFCRLMDNLHEMFKNPFNHPFDNIKSFGYSITDDYIHKDSSLATETLLALLTNSFFNIETLKLKIDLGYKMKVANVAKQIVKRQKLQRLYYRGGFKDKDPHHFFRALQDKTDFKHLTFSFKLYHSEVKINEYPALHNFLRRQTVLKTLDVDGGEIQPPKLKMLLDLFLAGMEVEEARLCVFPQFSINKKQINQVTQWIQKLSTIQKIFIQTNFYRFDKQQIKSFNGLGKNNKSIQYFGFNPGYYDHCFQPYQIKDFI